MRISPYLSCCSFLESQRKKKLTIATITKINNAVPIDTYLLLFIRARDCFCLFLLAFIGAKLRVFCETAKFFSNYFCANKSKNDYFSIFVPVRGPFYMRRPQDSLES